MILVYDGSLRAFYFWFMNILSKIKTFEDIYKTLPNEMIFEEIKEIETIEQNSKKVLDSMKKIFPNR